jgi:predicted nucleic acid-binding Zn ribbon protein
MPPLGPGKRNAKTRVLAQWRGVDLAPAEKTLEQRTRHVSTLLPKVFSSIRFDNRRSEAEIVRVWNELLAPEIVAHAQPTGLRKGTLFVTVDSSAWLSEIVRYRKAEILERLRHSFGSVLIKKLSFSVG